MRREVLINAVRRVLADLEGSGVVPMLEAGMDVTRRPAESTKELRAGWVSFEVFQKYSLLSSTYGDAERQVVRILGLSELSTAALWSKMNDFSPPQIHKIRWSIIFAVEYLPKLLQLIEQDHVEAARMNSADQQGICWERPC